MNARLTPCGGDAFTPTMRPWTGRPTCYWCKQAVENAGKCGEIFMPVPHDRERMAGIVEAAK